MPEDPSLKSHTVDGDVELTSEKIMENLSVVYEDGEIVVYTAPTEDELKRILLDLLGKHKRMTIRDLHRYLSGLASEDKIRYALNKLMKENLVVVDREGYYYLADSYEEFVTKEDLVMDYELDTLEI